MGRTKTWFLSVESTRNAKELAKFFLDYVIFLWYPLISLDFLGSPLGSFGFGAGSDGFPLVSKGEPGKRKPKENTDQSRKVEGGYQPIECINHCNRACYTGISIPQSRVCCTEALQETRESTFDRFGTHVLWDTSKHRSPYVSCLKPRLETSETISILQGTQPDVVNPRNKPPILEGFNFNPTYFW